MDYKYIEQLLERYWECDTTVEEERILRSFFNQKDVPTHLAAYKDIFVYEEAEKDVALGADFDARIMQKIDENGGRALIIPFVHRLRPFFRAAAIVAVIVTVGNAIQHSFKPSVNDDYNYDSYQDTYTDPDMAYEKVSSTLMLMSEEMNTAQSDSVQQKSVREK